MITLHGRTNSSNVAKVAWTLDYLNIPFRRLDVGGTFGGNNTSEFLAKNPNGLVPVLEDDGAELWESNAIVRYLASRYGNDRLWPAAAGSRALADAWMDWSSTSFYRPVLEAFRAATAASGSQDSVEPSVESARKVASILDDRLAAGPYVMGDFSVADIVIGVHVGRLFAIGSMRSQLPAVTRYYDRLLADESYVKNVQKPLLG